MAGFWMVRAGTGGYVLSSFEKHKCVAINFWVQRDLTGFKDRQKIKELVQREVPDVNPQALANGVAMMFKFVFEMKPGDTVITYDPQRREYMTGKIGGPYSFKPNLVPDHAHTRAVKWEGRISRDDLSPSARNTLGSTLTLFEPGDDVDAEIARLLAGEKPEAPVAQVDQRDLDLDKIRQDLIDRAHEFIKDRVTALDWQEMQELLAAVLRAMNYRTRVSPQGSDQGKDIVASPDGLGLASPRIKVEVKHRPKTAMGAPEVRSFIGGLRGDDRGLYVSTGGFTKEAVYEAERVSVPVTLLNLDDVASLLVQHYDNLDSDGRALVPLIRIFWPTS